MDERLEKALEFSNYMVTLNNQKRVIRHQYQEQIVYYFNGGQFTVTKELVTFVNMLVEKDNTNDIVLVDDNETPILIPDLENFLSDIIDQYFTAANTYYTEYQKLLKNRSTKKLVEIDE
jgi:predicted transglutaminase-like protease